MERCRRALEVGFPVVPLPGAGTVATAMAWHEDPHTVIEHHMCQIY